MRNIIDRMRNVGATDTTVNFFIVVFIVVIALILVGSFIVSGILLLQGIMPPNWLTGIITALIGAVVVLISISSQTQHINGTAAKAAGQTAANLQPTLNQAVQAGQVNAETLQQLIQMIMALQTSNQQTIASQQTTIAATSSGNTSTDTQANTTAMQANTAATQENTQVEKGHSHG